MSKKEPSENVSIAMPMTLLTFVDEYCHRNDLNRSQFINRSIRTYIAIKAAKDNSFWEDYARRVEGSQND